MRLQHNAAGADPVRPDGHAAAQRLSGRSEFGRRAEENASRGTDHGAAAPVLVLGGPGKGGLLGSAPDLARLSEGDVGYTTDFRALYTAIERNWMGLDPSCAIPAFEFGG